MITNIEVIPKTIGGIYLLTYENGKYYIGQALNIRARALEHNSKNIQLCDKMLKKYNAKLTILEEITDIQILNISEKYWIAKYKSNDKNFGYNLTEGGDVSEMRGTKHPLAALNENQLNEVIELLINHTELSIKAIAEQYNVSIQTIMRINEGQSYFNPNLLYPLRRNNHNSMLKNDILDYFNSTEELLQLKNDLKYRWDLTIEEDLVKKYNIPLKVLRDINQGRKFNTIGEFTYPIRKNNVRNNKLFTQTDILNILELLKNTSKTMSEIGQQYNIHRDTVSKINKGESYPIYKYVYPARK